MTRTRTSKLLALTLIVLMAVGVTPITVFAATNDDTPATDSWEVSKSKTATPAETRDANQEFTVELSLPAAEHENMYDIVFVIDDSTSTNNADFRTKAANLLTAVYAQDCNVKVGVIGFKGAAQDIIHKTDADYSGLTLITDANKDIILKAVKDTSAEGNGTNVHGGLRLARKWLDDDTSVPKENKYVVLLTDCRTYIWDDDNGKPTTIYAQYSRALVAQNGGWPSANQIFNYDKNSYISNFPQEVREKSAPFRFTTTALNYQGEALYKSNLEAFKGLYNSDNTELTGSTKYDTAIDFSWVWANLGISSDGSVTTRGVANTSGSTGGWITQSTSSYGNCYEFTRSANSTIPATVAWLEMNPYETTQNDNGTVSYDYTKMNEDCVLFHISNLEKGVYKAAHLWTELNTDFNCYSVIYQKGSGAGLETAFGMRDWLLEQDSNGTFLNSDYGVDAGNSDSVKAMFNYLKLQIEYVVNSGTLTDVIGNDFDLVLSNGGGCPFILTVGGTALAATQDTTDENVWHFGAGEGSAADYTLKYNPDGTDGKTIVLEINVPVKTSEPVQISYKLKFKNPAGITAGKYPTNKYAKLDYVSFDETKGTEFFDVPEVEYIKPSNPDPIDPNTPTEPEIPLSDVPATGDNSNMALCIALVSLSLLGMTAAIFVRKRYSGSHSK